MSYNDHAYQHAHRLNRWMEEGCPAHKHVSCSRVRCKDCAVCGRIVIDHLTPEQRAEPKPS